MARVYRNVDLTDKQKAELLDKLITHAETIEDNKWIGGSFLPDEVKKEVRSNALFFLLVVDKEIKKNYT